MKEFIKKILKPFLWLRRMASKVYKRLTRKKNEVCLVEQKENVFQYPNNVIYFDITSHSAPKWDINQSA